MITRNLSTAIGRQCFIPSRFLDGLLPECLRTQYDFWQSDNNTLQGYERNPSTTSSHTTALVILLSSHGPADLQVIFSIFSIFFFLPFFIFFIFFSRLFFSICVFHVN